MSNQMLKQTNKYNLKKIGLGLMMYAGVFSMTGCDKGEDPIGPKVVNNKTVEINFLINHDAIYPIADKMPQYKISPKIDTLFMKQTGGTMMNGQDLTAAITNVKQASDYMKAIGGVVYFTKNSLPLSGITKITQEQANFLTSIGLKFEELVIRPVAKSTQNQR